MLDGVSVQHVVASVIVIFFAIGLHEYAHCKVADLAGDPTPAFHGRVTLNLTKHFELMGTILIIFTSLTGFGIGWGKPAPMRPDKMRNPRWDFFMAVAAGPLSNLIQAGVWGIIFRIGHMLMGPEFGTSFSAYLCLAGVAINLSLMMFNLIPLGVLDGHWLLGLLMPERTRYHWFKFNQQYGVFLLIGLIFLSQTISAQGGPGLLDFVFYPVQKMIPFFLGL